MINELNSSNFESEVLKSKEVVLVDFWASWCGPCRMLAPIMEEISKEVKTFKVNVDEEGDLAAKFGIISIPCVIAFKDGKEIARSIGLKSKEEILAIIK